LQEQTNIIYKNKATAFRILIVEAVITASIALLLYLGVDAVTAYSVILGGTVFIVPNGLFVGIVFWQTSSETAKQAISQIYIGEAVKILATIILFAACFILVRPISALAILGTYVLMMLINLIGLSLLKTDIT
jgi:ATP synthase protein I